MTRGASAHAKGFTLIEVLVALVILAALALLSYRGLDTILTAREHVMAETTRWQQLDAFLARFQQDVQMAAPYPVRRADGVVPAWQGRMPDDNSGPLLEFSRFASVEGLDRRRRVAYAINAQAELELWLWPGLDLAPVAQAVRYPVLRGVAGIEIHYMNNLLAWMPAWPAASGDAALPRAVRLRITLLSGAVITRVVALHS